MRLLLCTAALVGLLLAQSAGEAAEDKKPKKIKPPVKQKGPGGHPIIQKKHAHQKITPCQKPMPCCIKCKCRPCKCCIQKPTCVQKPVCCMTCKCRPCRCPPTPVCYNYPCGYTICYPADPIPGQCSYQCYPHQVGILCKRVVWRCHYVCPYPCP